MGRSFSVVFLCVLFGCSIIRDTWSNPVDKVVSEENKPVDLVVAAEVAKEDGEAPSKEDSTKFNFHLPSYLMGARPAPGWGSPSPGPAVFGNASSNGDVQGLFATNENSLVVISGPNSNAVANLTSTAAYFAQPINETQAIVDGGDTYSQNLAGFIVTAQEDTHASAEGEQIYFTNHGASYATGWGDSTANGTTYNPGPEGTGSGWKRPGPKIQDDAKTE